MSNVVDRRKFLTYTGAAGAATGAAWIAPSVLGSSTAFATGSTPKNCASPQTLNWASLSTAQQNSLVPSTTLTKTTVITVPAIGPNPAIDVRVTIAPIGSPGSGSYGSYSGTGGVNFAGIKTDNNPLGGTHSSYLMAAMQNDAFGEGYTIKFEFLNTGTTTPRSVFNLALSLGGLTQSGGRFGNNGYDDTVWLDNISPFTINHGSGMSPPGGTSGGTSSLPWIGTTGNDNNAWVNLNATGPINTFTVNYTNGTTHRGVFEWIWINNLTWC